ncbi:hypothetical protein BKA66DRAFT_223316 [Pyrenochaeta sp. MPI-SDFR-AT-0127]|nr:hypothetical protein BKA66DRAFT_223316 [Pyrenochaeta sp. MPI-SDFR-AT-0127]
MLAQRLDFESGPRLSAFLTPCHAWKEYLVSVSKMYSKVHVSWEGYTLQEEKRTCNTAGQLNVRFPNTTNSPLFQPLRPLLSSLTNTIFASTMYPFPFPIPIPPTQFPPAAQKKSLSHPHAPQHRHISAPKARSNEPPPLPPPPPFRRPNAHVDKSTPSLRAGGRCIEPPRRAQIESLSPGSCPVALTLLSQPGRIAVAWGGQLFAQEQGGGTRKLHVMCV